MAETYIYVLHDDGTWRVAQILGQHRDRQTGRWRVGVRYGVGVGQQYQRVLWADDCRAVDDPPAGWTDPRQDGRVLSSAFESTPGAPRARSQRVWP